ncbi:hypothetical protein CRUP_000119, partial [Coryphaenoides rupestris]
VPSVLFAPSHLMAVMTLGLNSALVMDCGYTETLVLPLDSLLVDLCTVDTDSAADQSLPTVL